MYNNYMNNNNIAAIYICYRYLHFIYDDDIYREQFDTSLSLVFKYALTFICMAVAKFQEAKNPTKSF